MQHEKAELKAIWLHDEFIVFCKSVVDELFTRQRIGSINGIEEIVVNDKILDSISNDLLLDEVEKCTGVLFA